MYYLALHQLVIHGKDAGHDYNIISYFYLFPRYCSCKVCDDHKYESIRYMASLSAITIMQNVLNPPMQVTLVGLWLIPAVFSFYFKFWLFIAVSSHSIHSSFISSSPARVETFQWDDKAVLGCDVTKELIFEAKETRKHTEILWQAFDKRYRRWWTKNSDKR